MSIASQITTMQEHIEDIYDTFAVAGVDTSAAAKNIVNINASLKERLEYYLANGLDVVWNNWEKVSGSGTEISLNNTIEAKMDFVYKGNTYQYSTTGKNLLNKELFTSSEKISAITMLDTGVQFITTSEASLSAYGRTTANIPLDSTKTYTISCDVTSDKSGKFKFGYYGTNGGSQTTDITANTKKSVSYQLQNITSSVVSLGFFLANATVKVENLMIVEGTMIGNYEPYTNGASPNPDYPQDIQVVTGDNTINVTGKNLMKFDNANNPRRSGYTYTSETPELVVCTKNNTGNDFYAQFVAYLESGKTYILSVDDDIRRNIYMYSDALWGTAISGLTNKNATKDAPFTFTSNYTGKAVIGFFGGESQTLTKPMLRLSSVEDTTYEPYKSQSYAVNLGVENLFQTPNTQTINGITLTKNNDGTFNLSGTATANTNVYLAVNLNDTKIQNGTYTISRKGTGYNTQIDFYNGNSWLATSIYVYGNNLKATSNVTIPNNATMVRFIIYVSNGTTINLTNEYIQLEKGSKANSYTPYGTTPIELCKIGAYQDYIYKSNNKWYVHKEIGKYILDGVNNVFDTKSGQTGNVYTFTTSDFVANPSASNVPSVKSDKFKAISWDDRTNYTDSTVMFGYLNVKNIQFRFGTSSNITTVELANTWLETNNVNLYGILSTPTDTEISDSTLLSQLNALENARSYDTQTNISQTNADKPFILDVVALGELEI